MANTAHSTNWTASEAIRNSHSRAAGKPGLTASSFAGRNTNARAAARMKPPLAASVAFQLPRRGASRRPRMIAPMPSSTLSRIIRKNSVVR